MGVPLDHPTTPQSPHRLFSLDTHLVRSASWTGGWDQLPLANLFSMMTQTPPATTNYVANSGVSYHTTLNVGMLSSHPPPISSSSIIVGNGQWEHSPSHLYRCFLVLSALQRPCRNTILFKNFYLWPCREGEKGRASGMMVASDGAPEDVSQAAEVQAEEGGAEPSPSWS